MDQIMGLMTFIYVNAAAHPIMVGLAVLCYLANPNVIVSLFAQLATWINSIKFSLFGSTVDFSKLQWPAELNSMLRDQVIAVLGEVTTIEDAMIAGTMSLTDGQAALEALIQGVATSFMSSAPAQLERWAVAYFGSTEVMAAQYLFTRIQAILYDLHPTPALAKVLVNPKKKKV